MEEHQHNEPFKEEYWQDALGVLEQEERKARRKKVVPLFFSIAALILVVFAVRYYVSPTSVERASTGTIQGPQTNRTVDGQTNNTSTNETAAEPTQPNDTAAPANSRYSDNSEVENTRAVTPENDQLTPEEQAVDEALTADDNSTKQDNEETSRTEEQNDNLEALETADNDSANTEEEYPQDQLDPADVEDTVDHTPGGDPLESILNQTSPELPAISTIQPGFGFANAAIKPVVPARLATSEGKIFSLHFEDKHREFLRLPTMSTPITLFVGNAFAPGYGSRKASHWNPQAGIALEHRVENNLWFRVSVGGQQISQTFASKSYLEEQASFGYEALETRISTDRLYLLDVPVGLVWDAFMRHSFIVGGGIEAIVRTENTLEKNKIDAFGTENIDSESSYGYLTGYNPIMYNLNIGYRYKFSKRNSLDIVASTGFHEVNQIGTSKNGRISVRYNFQIK